MKEICKYGCRWQLTTTATKTFTLFSSEIVLSYDFVSTVSVWSSYSSQLMSAVLFYKQICFITNMANISQSLIETAVLNNSLYILQPSNTTSNIYLIINE